MESIDLLYDYGVVIAVVAGFVVLFVMLWMFKPPEEEPEEQKPEIEPETKKKKKNSKKQKQKHSAAPKFKPATIELELRQFTSKKPLISVAVSKNAEMIAVMQRGYSGRIYLMKNILSKTNPASYDIDFGNENVTACEFSTDCKYLFVAFDFSRSISVYRVSTKRNSNGRYYKRLTTTRDNLSKSEITNIVSAKQFFLASSKDVNVTLGNTKGDILARIASHQMSNNDAAISSDARFIAIAAQTNEVKLWEMQLDGTGAFKSIPKNSRTYYRGHKTAVYGISFSGDTKRVATVSKDGLLRIYDNDLEKIVSGDPSLLHEISHPESGKCFDRVRFDQKFNVIAACSGGDMYLYDGDTAEKLLDLKDTHESILGLAWSGNGSFVVTIGTEGLVRVIKNPKKD